MRSRSLQSTPLLCLAFCLAVLATAPLPAARSPSLRSQRRLFGTRTS